MTLLFKAACLVLCTLTCVSCATARGSPGAMLDIKPGWRPDSDSDEAGLWMKMDRAEADLRTSGRLVKDPALNAYVGKVVCKLAGDYCPDIRVYIIQNSQFNTMMAPNGAMQVWTGLLLRVQNEAQLAHILSHEIGHYTRRHSVQAWRDLRTKTAFLQVFSMAVAAGAAPAGVAAGIGSSAGQLAGTGAQLITQLATLGNIVAFSRDNEREADEIGFETMVEAGYDPREVPKIWELLITERDAGKDNSPFVFFATHPNPEERIARLRELAGKVNVGESSRVIGREEYLRVVLPSRSTFLRDELRRREFSRTQVVLDQLFADGAGLGELFFFQGELHRLRDETGDLEKAIAAYEKALQSGQAPPEMHRSLGLVQWKIGDKGKARFSFEQYLQERPQAEDQEMIRTYIQQPEQGEKR